VLQHSVTLWLLYTLPCLTWWWPYRKEPKRVVIYWTPYTIINFVVFNLYALYHLWYLVPVGVVVDEVLLRQIFFEYFCLPLSASFLPLSIHIHSCQRRCENLSIESLVNNTLQPGGWWNILWKVFQAKTWKNIAGNQKQDKILRKCLKVMKYTEEGKLYVVDCAPSLSFRLFRWVEPSLHAVRFTVMIPGFKLLDRWTRCACYGRSARRPKQPWAKSRRPESTSETLVTEAVYNGIQYSIHDDQIVRDEPQSAVDGVNLQVQVGKSVSLQCIHRLFFTFSCRRIAHI
jgi:hypothetical protein